MTANADPFQDTYYSQPARDETTQGLVEWI